MALLYKKVFQLPYFTVAIGCTPHGTHNFTLDIFKNFNILKASVKEAVYLVKIICIHLHCSLITPCVNRNLESLMCSLYSSNLDGPQACICTLNLDNMGLFLLRSAISVGEMYIDIDETMKQRVFDIIF